MHEIFEKRPYKHFKGNLYYVHEIVCHSETGELYVSYQALYSPYKFYIKPLKLFAAKVEDGRTDNLLHQKYKFELYDGNIDGKLWSVVRNLCFPYKQNIEHTITHSTP